MRLEQPDDISSNADRISITTAPELFWAAACSPVLGLFVYKQFVLFVSIGIRLRGSCGSVDQMACLCRPPDRGVL